MTLEGKEREKGAMNHHPDVVFFCSSFHCRSILASSVAFFSCAFLSSSAVSYCVYECVYASCECADIVQGSSAFALLHFFIRYMYIHCTCTNRPYLAWKVPV